MRTRAIIVIVSMSSIIFIQWVILVHLKATLFELTIQSSAIEQEIVSVKVENGELQEQILQAQSYTKLTQEARKMGFRESENQMILGN